MAVSASLTDAPPQVHPTAVVDRAASLGANVVIGPYCIIGPGVSIGADTVLENNTTIQGKTTIGRGNRIGPFAVLGLPAQHLHDSGKGCRLEIGDRNTIREFVTIHVGTELGGALTRLGDDNFLMNYVHIGHDCLVGNRTILANACQLGGHTVVGDRANLGGMVAVHQFVKVGDLAMVGGASALRHDVPPYCMVEGNPARLRGLNQIGLKRNGLSADTLSNLKRAYRIVFRSQLTVDQATRNLEEEFKDDEVVSKLISFMRGSKRGVCR
jgi:UDP-N-acetylglucosamine acyltransferase